ncbi:MAG TPA: hypothetical protein DHW63_08705, partial [Hyphomonadaceae bacterium]|nr:hypothetical protein [Hyphomonadaceae bacterium]
MRLPTLSREPPAVRFAARAALSRLPLRRTLAVRAAGPIMSKRRERGGVRAHLVQDAHWGAGAEDAGPRALAY